MLEHVAGSVPTAPILMAEPSLLGVLDFAGTAQVLRMSTATLERLIRKDPSFPQFFRIGARRHMRIEDLRAWIDQKARAT